MKTYRIGKLESKLNNFFLDEEAINNFENEKTLFKYTSSFIKLAFFLTIGVMPPLMFGWGVNDKVVITVYQWFYFIFFCAAIPSAVRIINYDFRYHFFKKRFWPIFITSFWFLVSLTFGVILPLFGYHIFYIEIAEEVTLVTKYSFLGTIPFIIFLVFYIFEILCFSRRLSIRGLEVQFNQNGIQGNDPFKEKQLEKRVKAYNAKYIIVVNAIILVILMAFSLFF